MIFDVSLALPSFSVSLLISYSSIENSSDVSLFTCVLGEDELKQYSSIEKAELVDRQHSSIENGESDDDKQYSSIENEDSDDDKQYSSSENGESSLVAYDLHSALQVMHVTI